MQFNIRPWQSIQTKLTLLSLAIFWSALWALTFYSQNKLHEDMQRISGEQQLSTVSLVADQIQRDLSDRLDALSKISSSVSKGMMKNTEELQMFLEQRQLLQQLFNGGVTVCNADGTAIADVSTTTGRIGTNYMALDTVANALKLGKSSIGSPVYGEKLNAPVFTMTVPIKSQEGKILGSLTGVVNLGSSNFLDYIIQNQYGSHGGYVLSIPDKRLIVTGTDKKNIMQALPAKGNNPIIDRFVDGYEGSATFTDPFHVEVLASVKRIPISNWMIAAKIPVAEAFSPARNMQQHIFSIALILSIATGVLTWLILRAQFMPLHSAIKTLNNNSKNKSQLSPLPVTRNDEIGMLISAFNQLIETLRERELALQESEQFARSIAFNIPGMVSYWNTSLHCTFACEEYMNWFGKSVEQMQNISMLDLVGEELYLQNKPYIDAALCGENVQFERALIKPDGELGYTWGHYISHKINGVVVGFFVFESDITQQKKIKQALEKSEVQYRRLAEDMPLLVISFMSNGTITYANSLLAATFSRTQNQLIGTNFFDYLSEIDKTTVLEKMRLLSPESPIESHEHLTILPSGEEVYQRWTNRAFFNAKGEMISMQAVGEDITSRKRLENEREKYFRFFQLSTDILCIADTKGCFKRVSPSFTKLTGFEEQELLTKPFMDFVVPEDRARTAKKLNTRLQSQPERRFENHYICKDGNTVLLSWAAYFDQESGMTYASARDITNLRQIEDALRESQARNQALISAIPDIIFTNNRKGEYLSVHAADPGMLYFSSDYFLHKKIHDILPQSIAEPLMQAVISAIDSNTVQHVQYRLPGDFEQERIFDARVVSSTKDTAITIVRDITELEQERMHHEQQLNHRLRTSEQDLALAADAAKLGNCLYDFSQDTIWASEQWRLLYGFTLTEPLHISTLLQRVHHADRQVVIQAFPDKVIDTDKCEIEFRIELPDGEIRWIVTVAHIEANTKGAPMMARCVSLDITDRKETELELQNKRSEVVRLSRIAMLGELSGALAHELNQPLTAILSNAQAAQRYLTQDKLNLTELKNILQDIVDEDQRAGKVIHGLRQMFDKGNVIEDLVNVNELISDVTRILRSDMINHGVKPRLELDPIKPHIKANQVQLQQVMINLLMNACDAMASVHASERLVIIRTQVTHDKLLISVIDQGYGVDATALDSIFDSFFTTKERGMGLGLSICKKIVDAAGGEIWCENNATRGASFHVSLPLQAETNT